jgi:ABC-type glycerol-3-phosphate transport system substrate-binding protein
VKSTLRDPRSALLCLLFLLAGCPKADSDSKDKPAQQPLKGVTIRLAVVDDPALAAAVARVKGEWNAQTGSEIEVIETTEKDLLRAERLPADGVLCPSHLLGVLAERKLLAPVPRNVLHSAEWAGVFSLLKLREAVWGDQPMAIPFGSPVFCCYYRADLLEKLGRRPPKTWEEYQSLAKLLAQNSPRPLQAGRGNNESPLSLGEGQGNKQSPRPLGEGQGDKQSPRPLGEGQGVRAWCGTIEPLAPGWAGQVLLARAAAYAKHRDNFSTLFDIETMEPLVSGPPFVQALEDLVAAAKFGPADPLHYDPAAVRAAFWRGECGMALTWPTAAERRGERRGERGEKGLAAEGLGASAASKAANDTTIPGKPDPSIRVAFVELPGSRRVFNLGNHHWEQRADDEDTRVPLLSISGRLGVVDKKSDRADATFQLLLWLSGSDMSSQVSAASAATTLFRQSNLNFPSVWVEKPVPATAAVQYADATAAALGREQWLAALRMPGRAEYLAALDHAVASAVRGEKSPLEALLEADAKWQKITARLGLEGQKAAYRHSLGLE